MFRIFKKLLIIFVNVVILSKLAYSSDTIFNKMSFNIPNSKIYNENGGELLFLNLFERNTIYLVNFWATWCQPCKKELPELEKIYRDLKDYNIKIYIISIDKKNIDEQINYLRENGIKDLIPLFDPEMKIFRYLKLRGIPTTIMINKNGYVVKKHEGILKNNLKITLEIKHFIN